MQFFRTIRLFWTFYKGFCFASLLITGACLFLYWEYGNRVWEGVICLKALAEWVIYFFINSYKQDQFYYYRNLRITKWMLCSATFAVDYALFIVLITFINPVA